MNKNKTGEILKRGGRHLPGKLQNMLRRDSGGPK